MDLPPRPNLDSVATIRNDGSRRFVYVADVRGAFTRMRKEKALEVDVKDFVSALAVASEGVLRIAVRNRKPQLKVVEIVAGILGIDGAELKDFRIKKIGVEWKTAGGTPNGK